MFNTYAQAVKVLDIPTPRKMVVDAAFAPTSGSVQQLAFMISLFQKRQPKVLVNLLAILLAHCN